MLVVTLDASEASPGPCRAVTVCSFAGAYECMRREMQMKKFTIVSILTLVFVLLPFAAIADDGATIYNAKCKMCHGADGKKLAKADLSGATIQAKADADLVKFITTDAKHKTKVADEPTAKTVVTFLRTLKK